MADITIYLGNKNYSSWSLRPWLALKHTGAPFREVVIPLKRPESAASIRACSPSGRLPVLHHGSTVVWESLAICEYLAEQFPDAGLWPRERAARAFARSICSEMHSGFADLRNSLPMDLVNRWPIGGRRAVIQADVDRICAIWRECRQRFGGHGRGEFLFGGFSIADAMYAPVAGRFVTYDVPLDETCRTYMAAVMTQPAMQEWTDAARREPWVMSFDVNAQAN